MPIEKWSDQIRVVHLADDPQFSDDLDALWQQMEQHRTNAVLDFSAVHFVNSSNISQLLKLRKQVVTADLKLLLCGMPTQVWSTFLVTGLDKIFDFSDNVPTALATLQISAG
jgi:anti-anti-sigma factor